MTDFKEKAGLIAAQSARDGLLRAYSVHGLNEESIAVAVKEALRAKRCTEVLTPKGWDVSPGVPDHKIRLQAANMLADTLDVKAPTRIDLTGRGLLGSAVLSLIEEVLTEQGITIDIAPQGQIDYRTAALAPSRFDYGDGFS